MRADAIPDEAVPEPVRLLRDFVNTAEPQTGDEALTSPDALAGWCRDRGLLPPGATLGAADLATARAVREGLRELLLTHAGHLGPDGPGARDAPGHPGPDRPGARDAPGHPGPDGPAALDAALGRVPLRASFDGSGELRLRAADGGPAGAVVAGLLDAVRRAGRDGSWDRLKVCARDSCRWAFYDTSRNRSGRWCSMAGCGNQVKMRRAHARRRAATPG